MASPLPPPLTPFVPKADDGGGEPDAEEMVPGASTSERAPANVPMVDLVGEPPSPDATAICAPEEPRTCDDVTKTGP